MHRDWFKYFLQEGNELQRKMEQTETAWNNFMRDEVIDKNCTIAPEILSSWKRCKERGLDPRDDSMIILSDEELQWRLKENEHLLAGMTPIVHNVADTISFSGHRIEFYDADLYLLKRFGRKTERQEQMLWEVELGTSARESDLGTVAINLAALLERPMVTTCAENYKSALHYLTSTAVPIMSRSGKLAGVLASEGSLWPLHKHTIGMMCSLKKEIESQLYGNTQVESMDLLTAVNRELAEKFQAAVVVVDRHGKIIITNERASQMICPNWPSIIGFSCETLWGKRNVFLEVLESVKTIKNRTVNLNVNGKPLAFVGTIKPIFGQSGRIVGAIGTLRNDETVTAESGRRSSALKAQYTFDDIIGNSSAIRHTVRLARETAMLQNNILIQGESGTGKELFAQAIHNESSTHQNGPFVAINCAAIPYGLLESELFGYVGGAFTGAKKEGCRGKFETASEGTVFLDEINSMPLDMQVKILRTIQTKKITKVGGSDEIPVDIRIIAASNVDLWEMVKAEKFREDLYYRINVIGIRIPPLRERKEDIPVLVEYLLRKICVRLDQDMSIGAEAIDYLKKYDWPGNIRELENVLERGFVLARTRMKQEITYEELKDYSGLDVHCASTSEILGSTDSNQTEQPAKNSERKNNLREAEMEIVRNALAANRGNVLKTAQELGVARNTLYKKMKQFGIKAERQPPYVHF